MAECVGIGRIIGHRYRARESQVSYESSNDRESFRHHATTYEGESCERCGHRLERRADERPEVRDLRLQPTGPRRAS